MNEVVLSAAGLRRTVGDRVLWQDFDLELRGGECVALTGPSGRGKSLLLRTLAGMDPIEQGEILLQGRPQQQWHLPEWRARLAWLAQRPALFEGTVEDNLRRPFALKLHHALHFDRNEALALFAALGRDQALFALQAATLSGGEGQLVALVRALLLRPTVLLLDEPTASLDPSTTAHAEALLRRWREADPGRACVWVSHDPAQRARVATREVAL